MIMDPELVNNFREFGIRESSVTNINESSSLLSKCEFTNNNPFQVEKWPCDHITEIVSFERDSEFGKMSDILIQAESINLLSNFTLKILIPATELTWKRKVAYKIIDQIDVYINNKPIFKFTGAYLDLERKVFFPNQQYKNQILNIRRCKRKIKGKKEIKLNIPLPFFRVKNKIDSYKCALPGNLTYHFIIKFNNFKNCVEAGIIQKDTSLKFAISFENTIIKHDIPRQKLQLLPLHSPWSKTVYLYNKQQLIYELNDFENLCFRDIIITTKDDNDEYINSVQWIVLSLDNKFIIKIFDEMDYEYQLYNTLGYILPYGIYYRGFYNDGSDPYTGVWSPGNIETNKYKKIKLFIKFKNVFTGFLNIYFTCVNAAYFSNDDFAFV